ncbi:MAG: hypothetical protein MR423_02955 [Firmicutes bacterium]|nr:hypothetical protein [Bacillota bacterium]MDY3658777.1 hypothetical protein [Eubacteriales bacterium]
MNFSNEILLVMLIGIIASATDTDLANNTNILLLLLLILLSSGGCGYNSCCRSCDSCGNLRTSGFFV